MLDYATLNRFVVTNKDKDTENVNIYGSYRNTLFNFEKHRKNITMILDTSFSDRALSSSV